MTDWYIEGYKVTVALLRGGARVIVIRRAMDNRYIRHFTDIADFNKWIEVYEQIERSEED